MSAVRTHFCTLVARGHGAGSSPSMYGMNCTIPAIVNRVEGSGEIRGADGTTVCPRSEKNSSQRRRISAERMNSSFFRKPRRGVTVVLKVLFRIVEVRGELPFPHVGFLRSAVGARKERLSERLFVFRHGGF